MKRYIRIWNLQDECFRRGKKRWAKRLGEVLKELRADNPELKHL